MNDLRLHLIALVCLLAVVLPVISSNTSLAAPESADSTEYDIVIYGGTSAGVATAVQAQRLGLSAVLVSPDRHLGGLTSGGLGWTDSGNKAVIGGLSREFYQRVKKHYDDRQTWAYEAPDDYSRYRPADDAQWTFEPHIAEQVFEEWIAEKNVPVFRDRWLDRKDGVTRKDGRITSIRTLSGETYRGRIFVDATYEGDLLAAAGISYTVGREGNDVYGETLNGVQTVRTVKHQFDFPVDPYRKPGDPASGLLPLIHDGDPGKDGAGDKRVQAYNFRMCLTQVERNRVPFPKPAGYDPLQYELLGRYLDQGWRDMFKKFDMLPNLKTDTNNHGAFSTDNIGMNYDYPEASYERRREIIRQHEDYQKGLMWFLAYDARTPEDVRAIMSQWGLSRDEFQDNDHWPRQIYVREARRMVGDFVMTEMHLRGLKPTPSSVGMGSYNMDSHNVQRYVDADGHARNEGDIQVNPGGPYPISYKAIVPRKSECTNLLVPVCLSSSHIAYGSIRMEPVFMVLGHSAATAASIALNQNLAVQDIPYDVLERQLLAERQVLSFERPPRPMQSILAASLPGVVIDDEQAAVTGSWTRSSSVGPFVEAGYRHDGNVGKGEASARFTATLPAGRYEVRLAYSPNPNRATNVPVELVHAGGTAQMTVNQKKRPEIDGLFHSLGTFNFAGEQPAIVIIRNNGTNGYVLVDAIQFVPESK